jgi:hypothetical protein
MARNPRTKLAAVAVAAIATLGIIATGPATASANGAKTHTSSMRSDNWCCS